ncbi:hypothetical protein BY996DRAFT_6550809, partial [Phakopsora pachyrhizi]
QQLSPVKEGATDDCSWVRDKSFPDDVIETNGSATAFQGKTRGKEFIPITTSDPNLNQGLTLRREICVFWTHSMDQLWGVLSSILDVQNATMGLEKCQERDFELGAILRQTIGILPSGPTVRVFKPSHRKIKLSENRQVMRGDDDVDVESTGQGDLIGAAGSIKRTGTCQTKETRDLSNQKEDEFEDKKTLNRLMLQKGGPNKNWKSTTDGLKERMDGSDLHPQKHLTIQNKKWVVEFDSEYGYGKAVGDEARAQWGIVLAHSGDWSATVDAHMGQTYILGLMEGMARIPLRMGMMEGAQQLLCSSRRQSETLGVATQDQEGSHISEDRRRIVSRRRVSEGFKGLEQDKDSTRITGQKSRGYRIKGSENSVVRIKNNKRGALV